MSLKSIKKNYVNLLKTFSDVGVTLNESQKETLDNFISDIQETIESQRDTAIRATKKIVEDKLEAEYKKEFESLMKEMKTNSDLATKVQEKVSEQNESSEIVDAVDAYLTEHVEKILPEKTIVDYTRMKKNEQILESLRNMFMISDSDISSKIDEAKAEVVKESTQLKEELEVYKSKQQEQTKTFESMSKQISELKAINFINEKAKKLPIAESKELLKRTKGMGFEEVKKNFKTILESVQESIADQQTAQDDEKNLEEAITSILEGEKEADSETPDNGEITTSDKDAQGTESNPDADSEINNTTGESSQDDSESVIISESQMQDWITTLNRITPKK